METTTTLTQPQSSLSKLFGPVMITLIIITASLAAAAFCVDIASNNTQLSTKLMYTAFVFVGILVAVCWFSANVKDDMSKGAKKQLAALSAVIPLVVVILLLIVSFHKQILNFFGSN